MKGESLLNHPPRAEVSAWDQFRKLVRGKISENQPIAPYTSYGLGGPVRALVEPKDTADVQAVMRWLAEHRVPYLLLGGGTNVLFADEGFRGVVIRLGKEFQGMAVEGETLRAKAATPLVLAMRRARQERLSGLEFCAGIPGTVGGAIAGNAGTRTEWMGERVCEVTVVDDQGEVRTLEKNDLHCAYRHTVLKEKAWPVVEAVLQLQPADREVIDANMRRYFQYRRGRQPKIEKNAGSVFKNPPGDFAGRLVEQLGLKGKRVGRCRISEIHGNFIIHEGGGSAREVLALMREIQLKVFEATGIRLEPEILPMGDWNPEEIAAVWDFSKGGDE